jgi:hypothetical protein
MLEILRREKLNDNVPNGMKKVLRDVLFVRIRVSAYFVAKWPGQPRQGTTERGAAGVSETG